MNLFIISHMTDKLFNVFREIIKLLINASIPGFFNMGTNNFPKKNFAMNEFFSVSLIEGNFFVISNDIILHRHFNEYGKKGYYSTI